MNEKNLHTDLEKRLKKAGEELRIPPSEKVWENVRSAIPRRSGAVLFKKWLPLAALVALLFVVGRRYLPSDGEKVENKALTTREYREGSTGGSSLAKEGEKQETPAQAERKQATPAGEEREKAEEAESLAGGSFKERESSVQKSEPLTKVASAANASQEDPAGNDLAQDFAQVERLFSPLSGLSVRNLEPAPVLVPETFPASSLLSYLNEPAPEESDLKEAKEEKKGRKGNRFLFSLYAAPGISYRSLDIKNKTPDPNPDVSFYPSNEMQTEANQIDPAEERDIHQKRGLGWEAGFRVGYQTAAKWRIQTGVGLQRSKYHIKAFQEEPGYVSGDGRASISEADLVNSYYSTTAMARPRPPALPEERELENKYLKIQVPFLLGKVFGDEDRFSVAVDAGVGLAYLIGSDAFIYAPRSHRYFEDKEKLKNLTGNFIFETAATFPLGRKMGLSVGPFFTYQFTNSYKNYKPVKEYPYLLGLKSEIRLR